MTRSGPISGESDQRVAAWRRRLANAARSLRSRTAVAATRFPVAVLAIVCAALAANADIADAFPTVSDSLLRLQAALFSAASAAIAVTLFSEASQARRIIDLAVQFVAAGLVGAAVRYGLSWGIFAPALIGGILLAVPLAPYLKRGDGLTFWTFSAKMIVGGAFAFAAVVIFVVGVLAIIHMIGFLFDFDIKGSIDTHIVVTALTLVGPLFALGQVPRNFDDRIRVREDDQSVRPIALLSGWVSAPLALVAAVVLTFYGAKILVTGDVPKGEIGWIVSVFALLTVCLRIAAEPIQSSGGSALRLFSRIWSWTLILPLGLLSYAVWLRIDAEGVTLSRYYLALGGICAALIALIGAVSGRRLDIRWLVAVPAVFCLTSSVGPQGVVQSVGRSQAERIEVLYDGDIDAERSAMLSDAERREARSRIHALDDVGELDRIASLDDTHFDGGDGQSLEASAVIDRLGLQVFADSQTLTSEDFPGPSVIDSRGFDRLALFVDTGSDRARNESRTPVGGDAPSIRLDEGFLVVELAGVTDRFAVSPSDIQELRDQGSPEFAAHLTIRSENGRTIGFLPIRTTRTSDGGLVTMTGHLLYSSAEWR